MWFLQRKILVTFIDKKWNRLKVNVKVGSVPRIGELIYLGEDNEYYKVNQVIHWPSKDSRIFIVIDSLSSLEEKYKKVINIRDNED